MHNKEIITPENYWTGNGLLQMEYPWLVPGAVLELGRVISPGMTVLEFGAGGSTLFFARRAGRVISFENPGRWRDLVTNEIGAKNIQNVQFVDGFDQIPTQLHYDVILVDNSNDRVRSIEFVISMNVENSIIVIDNYARYSKYIDIIESRRVEIFDDPHWDGQGTMIIYK